MFTYTYTYWTREGKFEVTNYDDMPIKQLHREDGPAVVRNDGFMEWYVNGKNHREDGPAVVYPEADKFWYLDGVYLSELRHFNRSPYFQSLPSAERVLRRLMIQ